MIGRRPVFFLTLCVICVVLIPVTPSEYRWVNLALAGLALFWTIALALEDLSLSRRHERGGPAPCGPGLTRA